MAKAPRNSSTWPWAVRNSNVRFDTQFQKKPCLQSNVHFAAAEHELIAQGVHLYTINEEHRVAINYPCYPVKTGSLWWKKTITLNFGRIIALAGDYYSTYERGNNDRVPICGAFFKSSSTPRERFRTAVDSLIFDKESFLNNLTGKVDGELDKVNQVHSSGKSVPLAYHDHACGIPTDTSLVLATIGKWSKSGLYAWLGYINADHFVSLGHFVALAWTNISVRVGMLSLHTKPVMV